MTNEMFEMPAVQPKRKPRPKVIPAPQLIPARNEIRVEFFDNGEKPGRGRTRYGLVVDCGRSKERYYINFGVQNYDKLWRYREGSKASVEDYRNLQAMHDRYVGGGLTNIPTVYLAAAKRHHNPGVARTYNFRAGHRDLYHRVGAIMWLNPSYAPWVVLYVDGLEVQVPNDWNPSSAPNPDIKYEVRF